MAVRKAIITYMDMTKENVYLTQGDQLRANREAEKRDSVISKANPNENLFYQGYLAAKKAGLKYSELEFLDWADHVTDFDIALNEEMIQNAYIAGEIDENKREMLLERVPSEEALGESTATQTT